MNNHRVWILIAVVAHLIVNIFHGLAHANLGVGLNAFQQLFILVVIVIAPLVALALSFTRYIRPALWLLLVSMLGSFIFGGLYHYFIISPDHVAHLPPGDARGMFRLTAALLLVTDGFGVIVPALALRTPSTIKTGSRA
jgi:hypothetical protein